MLASLLPPIMGASRNGNNDHQVVSLSPGGHFNLTPKHRETHGCVVSTVATNALVLKHQAISIHNAD